MSKKSIIVFFLLAEELSASEDRLPSTDLVIFLISGIVSSVYLLP
jgi:hypothetical protein